MKIFKNMFITFVLGSGLLLGSANATLISNTVGDVDCFGLGGSCADGDLWIDDLGGVFFTDYRSAADLATAEHTDIWDSPVNPTITHTYDLGGETAVSAFFDIFIAGFADIGPVDLLADGVVIANFFFDDQFQTVHSLTTAVSLGFIDGSTVFTVATGNGDGFIIDSSTLRIETSSTTVPEPASLALLGLGLVGLGFSRRKSVF